MRSRPLLGLLACLSLAPAVPAALAAQDWGAVDDAIRAGIASRLYPGAVLVVGRRDTILYARGYGHFSWRPGAPRPGPDSTLWDLASLTKVVATASTAMVLVNLGLLDLDAPVSRYLPAFTGEGRDQITVRMLLDHTSGLRPWAPLWSSTDSRADAIGMVLAETPRWPPGAGTHYSDLNGILLGLVLEHLGGARLDALAAREVFAPLGMLETRFLIPAALLPRTAPSRQERDGPRAGVVNDDNARRLDGVAGHAGLFSTGADLARFAQAWLAQGMVRGRRWVSAATMQEFLTRSPGAGTRALGWDTPPDTLDGPSMFGLLAHEGEIGHTGWTGTSIWIDPEADLFVVFLTNRTLGTARRSLNQILLVRTEVSDAARRAGAAQCLAARTVAC